MRVKLHLPTSMEAKVTFDKDEDGNIRALVIEPHFFQPAGMPPVFYAESTDKRGRTIQKAIVQLSGGTGKLSVADRTTPKMSKYDQMRYKPNEDPDE